MTYRIRTVSEITGIPRNTLIAWERRYGVIRPVRHSNGYRSYSEQDVAQLLRIKNAQKAGLKISEAFALLEQGHDSDEPTLTTGAVQLPGWDQPDLDQIRVQLTAALVGYRREEAERLLSRLSSVPFKTRVTEIYFPVLTEIGERWANGEVTIAQEHYSSSVIRAHLASILVNIGPASSKAPHAACTTFPADDHEIAALALCIQLSLAGFRVSYLGPNLPTSELAVFVAEQKPILVCVSVINPVSADQISGYSQQIAAALPENGKLVLGGRVLSSIEVDDDPRVRIEARWEAAVLG